MSEGKRKNILEVNSLFMFAAILLATLGTIFQRNNLWVGSILTEVLLILIPSFLYIFIKKYSYKEILKLNKISIKDVIIVIVVAILLYPIATFIQGVFVSFINYIKPLKINPVPLPNDIYTMIRGIIIIALIPSICEEVLFRGVILDGYKGIGIKKSIVISSIYFGMMHFTITNFIGPVILGLVFGFMVYKTNSIYASIIAHFINNSIALIFGYFLEVENETLYIIMNEMSNIDSDIYILLIIGFLFIIYILLNQLGENVDKEALSFGNKEDDGEQVEFYDITVEERGYENFTCLSPIVVVIFIYIHINLIYVFI